MCRALVLAALAVVASAATAGQTLVALRIRVAVTDANGRTTPVARHALIISDNIATTEARRVLTGLDGTVSVRVSPSNYTVESDEPLVFQGQAYHWRQTLDIAAGRTRPSTSRSPTPSPNLRCGGDQRRYAPLDRHLAAAAAVAGQRRRTVDCRLHTRRDSLSIRPDSLSRTRKWLATRRPSRSSSPGRSRSWEPSSRPIVNATLP